MRGEAAGARRTLTGPPLAAGSHSQPQGRPSLAGPAVPVLSPVSLSVCLSCRLRPPSCPGDASSAPGPPRRGHRAGRGGERGLPSTPVHRRTRPHPPGKSISGSQLPPGQRTELPTPSVLPWTSTKEAASGSQTVKWGKTRLLLEQKQELLDEGVLCPPRIVCVTLVPGPDKGSGLSYPLPYPQLLAHSRNLKPT